MRAPLAYQTTKLSTRQLKGVRIKLQLFKCHFSALATFWAEKGKNTTVTSAACRTVAAAHAPCENALGFTHLLSTRVAPIWTIDARSLLHVRIVRALSLRIKTRRHRRDGRYAHCGAVVLKRKVEVNERGDERVDRMQRS